MSLLAYKPNAEAVLRRLRALYNRQATDQIFAVTLVPSPTLARFRLEHAAGYCDDPDLDGRVQFWDSRLKERAALEDDSIPSAYLTEMDQGLYGGMVGGKVRFLCDLDTGWISSMVFPILRDWSEFDHLRIDDSHPWFKRYVEELDHFIAASRGKFGVSHFILIDSLNFIFELLGATKTYLSLDEEPDMVRRAIAFAFEVNALVHDAFFERVPLLDGGTCSNKVQWVPGRAVSESVDPFHMTSVAYFETWGREPVQRIFDRYDGGILHIHANGRHLLEAVSNIKGLKAIEMGDDKGLPRCFEIARELRRRTGDVPLTIRAEYGEFLDALDQHALPGGILYYVLGVPDADAANTLMERVRDYRI